MKSNITLSKITQEDIQKTKRSSDPRITNGKMIKRKTEEKGRITLSEERKEVHSSRMKEILAQNG